jgi:hypothetical protein
MGNQDLFKAIVYSLDMTVLQEIATLVLDLIPGRGVARRGGART